MKKLLLILLCLPMIGFGQNTEAGKFYIAMESGPSMGFQYGWSGDVKIEGVDSIPSYISPSWSENTKQQSSSFNINGQFGYFIVDGLVTGLSVSYGSGTQTRETVDDFDFDGYDDKYTYKYTYSSLSLRPFLKYYIGVGNNALFVKTSYQFPRLFETKKTEEENTSSISVSGPSFDSNSKWSQLNFGAGMAFFLTESIALEPSINYRFTMSTIEDDIYIGNNTYDVQQKSEIHNSIYVGIAASMYF